MATANTCPNCKSTDLRRQGKKLVERVEMSGGEIMSDHDMFFVGEVECTCYECGEEWTVMADDRLAVNVHHGDGCPTDTQYIDRDGRACPYCGEDALERSGQMEPRHNTRQEEPIFCTACETAFYDVWQLTGYQEVR